MPCFPGGQYPSVLPAFLPGTTPLRPALHTQGAHPHTLHPWPHLPPALVHTPLTWWLWFLGPRGADWSWGILFSAAAVAGGGGGQVPLQTGTCRGPPLLALLYTHTHTCVHTRMCTQTGGQPDGPSRLAALRPQAQELCTHLKQGPLGEESGAEEAATGSLPGS